MVTAPRVAITGAFGFLGWHTSARFRAVHGVEPLRIGREDFASIDRLRSALTDVDTVIHLAGVNRAPSDLVVEQANVEIASTLALALEDRPVHLVYAGSIQEDGDTPYGRGKRRAAEILATLPGTLAHVLLPNLFGEHGRPGYNSFVATFCEAVARDQQPVVSIDREVPLLHVQDAAEALIDAAMTRGRGQMRPAGAPRLVSHVLSELRVFHELYRHRGDIPDLADAFSIDLFNTYRSYLFPGQFPIFPQVHADLRGELLETSRSHGGQGLTFMSTTRPGRARGDHYHLRRFERFFVVRGEAEVTLRRLLQPEVITFRLSGDAPAFVDMPTLWAHSIRNVGNTDLLTVFWSNQLLDQEHPDQYPEEVNPS